MGTLPILYNLKSTPPTPDAKWATNRPRTGAGIAREINSNNILTSGSAVDRLETFKPNIVGSRSKPLIMRYPTDLGQERTEMPHVMQFKIYWRWENPEIIDNAATMKIQANDRASRVKTSKAAEDFVKSLIDDNSFTLDTLQSEQDKSQLGLKGGAVLRNPTDGAFSADPSKDAGIGDRLQNRAKREEGRREFERGLRSANDRVEAIAADMDARLNTESPLGYGSTDISQDETVLSGRLNKLIEQSKGTGLGAVTTGLQSLGLKQRDPQYDQMVSIYLPICTRVNNEDMFGYTDTDMKIPAGIVALGNQVTSAEDFGDFAGKLTNAAKTSGVAYLTSALSSTAFAGVVPSVTGLVLNPRVEKMFQQKELRQFTFSWDLYPRNADEVRTIKDIIDTFRYHAHPARMNDGDVDGKAATEDPQIMLRVPAEFTVKFLSTESNGSGTGFVENEYIPKISRCVITSISVDYTPNGVFGTLKDNSPVAYSLSITVSEIGQLTREDVEKGF